MSRLLIELYIALALLGGEEMSGYAPRYAPGVMERVAQPRPAGGRVYGQQSVLRGRDVGLGLGQEYIFIALL